MTFLLYDEMCILLGCACDPSLCSDAASGCSWFAVLQQLLLLLDLQPEAADEAILLFGIICSGQ